MDGGAPEPEGVETAQLVIEQRVIIRVPMRRSDPPPPETRRHLPPAPPPPRAWVERKGPKCISVRRLVGATITSSHGVDLMLNDRERLRARLGRECRLADLYSGFYIRPNADGLLCAGRDRILTRSGVECEVAGITRLVPER